MFLPEGSSFILRVSPHLKKKKEKVSVTQGGEQQTKLLDFGETK